MPDLTCIYCLRDVPAEEFNREHVISEALGTFENNFTLLQTVCRTCNQFFGDELELVFGRDSFEAYDRLKHGLKRAKDIPTMPQRRLNFTAALSGELEGLRLSLVAVDGSEAVALVPQVGLPKMASRGWTYLTEAELADLARPLPADFDREGLIRIIALRSKHNTVSSTSWPHEGFPFTRRETFPCRVRRRAISPSTST